MASCSIDLYNGNVILYLDGAFFNLIYWIWKLAAHSDVQHFGYSNGAFGSTNYYGGLMDDLVHYPSVLSLSDIIKLF
jgi:hypothetical protein